MRLIEKIKKFFSPPEQCSTCKYYEHTYDRFGYCRVLNRQDYQVMECFKRTCQLYERKDK